jgi:hypothetical protein
MQTLPLTAILLVSDLFEPVDDLALLDLVDGDMRHSRFTPTYLGLGTIAALGTDLVVGSAPSRR